MIKKIQSSFLFVNSVLLFYTGLEKIINFNDSAYSIAYSGLFSKEMIPFILICIIVLEFVIAMILLLKPKIGLFLLAILFLIFTFYIVYLWVNDRYVICGCGGVLNNLSFFWHFLINMSIFSLSILLLKFNSNEK